ncbi:MAG TPA: hypothetical protein VHS09_11205, partial [Polyangiaceae bacterium]|nr:hypothetical protein [Polyangiaceae bacterium]
LVGLGNDLDNDHDKDGAYRLGPTLDIHYAYLTGLPGGGGWSDWNPNGGFVDMLVHSATTHGTTPMFTLYSMAAWGEDKEIAALTHDDFMKPYWAGAKLLFQRLGASDKPSMVHVEPDFWAYAQQASKDGTHAVRVKGILPECGALTDDLRGMVGCFLQLAHTYAPHAVVGFHASSWSGSPAATVRFLRAIGADKGDFLAVEMLDRDCGCWEARTDPQCQAANRDRSCYLDETNTKSPNFHEVIGWAKQMHDGLGLPLLWWQVPLGVPSTLPGGTAGHYRDNRVHYMFAHVPELVDAGSVGMLFGTGAEHQTTIDTDDGQFKAAVTKYFASPVPLP